MSPLFIVFVNSLLADVLFLLLFVFFFCFFVCVVFFFVQAEDGIRDLVRSRGLGDVYKRQRWRWRASVTTRAWP